MVYIDDVHAQVFEKSLCKFVIYWYNNLLVWRTFHGHVDLGFGFAVVTIYDLLNYINLLVGKIWEHFFYFQCIHCNTWWWDWFDQFRLRGCLCVRLLLRGFIAFLEVLWDFINFFLWLCWNRWGKWGYEGSLAVLFPLLLTWSLVIWGLNFDLTLFLKVVLLLSMNKLSQWDLYIAEINSYIALPMPPKSLTLLALSLSIDLPRMYLHILVRDSLMFYVSVHLMPGCCRLKTLELVKRINLILGWYKKTR